MCSCACALAPAAPSRLSSTHSSSAMRLAPLQAQARLAQQHDGASGGATARRLRTQLGARPALPGSSSCAAGSRRQQSQRGRTPAATRAMVNVDVSPSVVLGVGLIGAGVSLWQIRRCGGRLAGACPAGWLAALAAQRCGDARAGTQRELLLPAARHHRCPASPAQTPVCASPTALYAGSSRGSARTMTWWCPASACWWEASSSSRCAAAAGWAVDVGCGSGGTACQQSR